MKKKILLFLLSIMLMLPCSLTFVACGQKEISGYEATIVAGTEYTYNEETKTFTISSNKNFRELLKSAFNVSVKYKDNSSQSVNYTIEISPSTELDYDCIIKVYSGEIEVETYYLVLTEKEQVSLEYIENQENLIFEYAAEEINVLEQIKQHNSELNNAINQNKVTIKEDSQTAATEINYNTETKYSFTIVANPGYYFIEDGSEVSSITYDWFIKQKVVSLTVPKAENYSLEFIPGTNYRGAFQTLELYFSEDEEEDAALAAEFKKYFDISEDVFEYNEAKTVGDQVFYIELNNQYKNNSNYDFNIITDGHSEVVVIGKNKQIRINWKIHKCNLGIDGFGVVYDEEDETKDFYPYVADIIVPVTNVDKYKNKLFNIELPKVDDERVGMVDVGSYPITITTIAPFVVNSYCFNNNQEITNDTIYFNIGKGTFVIDESIDEISDLRNGEYRDNLTFTGYWNLLNNRPVESTPLEFDYTVFKNKKDVEDLIGEWRIYYKDKELITGENTVTLYFYQNNMDTQWNPTEFEVKLIIEPQPFEVKLDWGDSEVTYAEDSQGNPTVLGKNVITNIYDGSAWVADDSNFNITVETKKRNDNNEYVLDVDGYVGYYKTTATLSWKYVNENGTKNRYLFTSDNLNQEKGDLILSFEWQIVPQQIDTDIVTINPFIRENQGQSYYWGYNDIKESYFAFLTEESKPFNYTMVNGLDAYVAEGEELALSVFVNNVKINDGQILLLDLGEYNIKFNINFDARKYNINTQHVNVIIENTVINVSNLDFATTIRSKSNKGTLEISAANANAGDGIPYKLVDVPYGVEPSYVFVNTSDSEDVRDDLKTAVAGETFTCDIEDFSLAPLVSAHIDGIADCTINTWQNSPITIKVV